MLYLLSAPIKSIVKVFVILIYHYIQVRLGHNQQVVVNITCILGQWPIFTVIKCSEFGKGLTLYHTITTFNNPENEII